MVVQSSWKKIKIKNYSSYYIEYHAVNYQRPNYLFMPLFGVLSIFFDLLDFLQQQNFINYLIPLSLSIKTNLYK